MPTKIDQRQSFEGSAAWYDLTYAAKDWAHGPRYIASIFPPSKHRRVLEFGAGTGQHTRQLGALGYTVTPTDPCPQMRAAAHGLKMEHRDLLVPELDSYDLAVALFAVFSYAAAARDGAAKAVQSLWTAGRACAFDFINLQAAKANLIPRNEITLSRAGVTMRRETDKSLEGDVVVHRMKFSTESPCGEKQQWTEEHRMRASDPAEIHQLLAKRYKNVAVLALDRMFRDPNKSDWYCIAFASGRRDLELPIEESKAD